MQFGILNNFLFTTKSEVLLESSKQVVSFYVK